MTLVEHFARHHRRWPFARWHVVGAGEPGNEQTLLATVREVAVLRVQPKAMTVLMAGLLPSSWFMVPAPEVLTLIAAPMVGGMGTAPQLSMPVIPAAGVVFRRRRPRGANASHAVRAATVSVPP